MPIVIAAVVVLALVVGAAFVITNLLRGSTPAAAQGIPAEAIAVVEANLNPAVADQLALKEFAEKFPFLSEDSEPLGENYKEAVWNMVTNGQDSPSFSEVEPWLGDSVAAGFLPPAENSFGEPVVVLAVEVTDQDAAEAFLAEHGNGAHTSYHDGVLLLSDEDSPVDIPQNVEASVAGTASYVDAMDPLGDGYLATAWFGPGLAELMEEATMAQGGTFDSVPSHGAIGLKVEDGTAVLRAVINTEGMILHDGDDVGSFVEGLPAGMLVSGAAVPTEQVDEVWEMIESTPELRDLATQMGIYSADDLSALLGNQIGLSVSLTEQDVTFGLAVETDNPERHSTIVNNILGQAGFYDAQHNVTDGVAYTTYGMSPSDMAETSTPAGDLDHFQELTQTTGDTSSVTFIDVNALESAFALDEMGDSEWAEITRTISGVGITQSVLNDDYAEVFFRVGTN